MSDSLRINQKPPADASAPGSTPEPPPSQPSSAAAGGDAEQPLIMQIVARKDLLEVRRLSCSAIVPQYRGQTWGIGPLMAQVAHATAAVLHETRTRTETAAYLADLKNMHKAR
jgi:hypothetical protein